ncbi:MAG: alpha/beta fold hydrolase [Kofleriaceae bacterium]|nr:alpha/beta fold hydrolase [Kofleriaceae bacterium]
MRRKGRFPVSQFFVHKERRIAYRTFGEGSRTIVFSHGLLMDVRMFSYLVPALVDGGNRVLLIDMLGHGDSDHPHSMASYSMTQFGDDVIALLDHLGIDEAVVGGTSLGANVALEAAVIAPERPYGDADRLAEEMPNAQMIEAKSIIEWRVSPSRLNHKLVAFLDEVWQPSTRSLL